MIKIEASKRLKVTAVKANPKKAQTYLESLGLQVTFDSNQSFHEHIAFRLDTKVQDAVKLLTARFGKPINHWGGATPGYAWKVEGHGRITIRRRSYGKQWTVALMTS